MHVPAGAVQHKMAGEGIAKNIIAALFPDAAAPVKGGKVRSCEFLFVISSSLLTHLNSPQAAKKVTSVAQVKNKKSAKKGRTTGTGCELMKLHWTPLSEGALKNSVWGKVKSKISSAKKNPSMPMVGGGAVDNTDITTLEEVS